MHPIKKLQSKILYKDIILISSLKLQIKDLDIKDICRIIEGREEEKNRKDEKMGNGNVHVGGMWTLSNVKGGVTNVRYSF
jgi:hypothetical protein